MTDLQAVGVRVGLGGVACAVQTANMGQQLAGGSSSWCPRVGGFGPRTGLEVKERVVLPHRVVAVAHLDRALLPHLEARAQSEVIRAI